MDFITCKLGDVGTIVGGATPSTKKSENYENGTIPWITPKDLSTFSSRFIQKGERNITDQGLKSCSTKLLPSYSILFSSRAPIGYSAINTVPVCTNQGFKSIIPNSDKVDYLFLYYCLKYNTSTIQSIGVGTTFPEISGKTMSEVEISIPQNIDDQKKIANILNSIDSKIELNNQINDNLVA